MKGIDYSYKDRFQWISVIRVPDFVTEKHIGWAVEEATRKKPMDCSQVEFFSYDEGLCVQCLHIGPYDEGPKTVALMHAYIVRHGYA
jgi:hypothetical protein